MFPSLRSPNIILLISFRKPEMIDRGCSPIPQVDLENKFEEQINLGN